jgi:hypothetical protein
VQSLGGSGVGAGAAPKAAKPLSASFADMMAAVETGEAATPSGPRPLSANFAEMMAAVDPTAATDAGGPTLPRDLEPRQRAVHAAPGTGTGGFELFGEDGLTFGDLIDVINPLQHIPIIGTIYRWLTGDEISPASSLAGGFLFGGPIGLAASAVNVAVEEATGDDIGGSVMTTMFGESPLKDEINLADAPPQRTWSVAEGSAAPAPPAAGGEAPPAPAPAAAAAPPPSMAASTVVPGESGHAVTLNEDQLATLLAMGGKRPLNPLPPPGAPAKLPPAPAAAAETAAVTGPDSGADVSTKMMSALDKYEAMVKARAATAAQPGAAAAGADISA